VPAFYLGRVINIPTTPKARGFGCWETVGALGGAAASRSNIPDRNLVNLFGTAHSRQAQCYRSLVDGFPVVVPQRFEYLRLAERLGNRARG
jgi:hypothetical protein